MNKDNKKVQNHTLRASGYIFRLYAAIIRLNIELEMGRTLIHCSNILGTRLRLTLNCRCTKCYKISYDSVGL
jgi:hypothetical protein